MAEDLRQECTDEHDLAPAESYVCLLAAVHQDSELLWRCGDLKTGEQPGYVLAARGEFLLQSLMPLLPTVCVHRRFKMDEVLFRRMERDDVQLALVTTVRPLADEH